MSQSIVEKQNAMSGSCKYANIEVLPKIFQGINRLLVSRRILFKKATVMLKGKLSKMKGSI